MRAKLRPRPDHLCSSSELLSLNAAVLVLDLLVGPPVGVASPLKSVPVAALSWGRQAG